MDAPGTPARRGGRDQFDWREHESRGLELALAAWRLSPHEAMALTDEQFNSLLLRLMERQERERAEVEAARGTEEREVSDRQAFAELGIKPERWVGKKES